MKLFSAIAVLLLSAAGLTVHAQSKDDSRYRKESEEIRKAVFAWDNPQFAIRDVPAKYAKASKVVLAHHTDLNADSKTKLAFYGFGFGSKKEQTITEVVREVVKLNDKTAVNEYSELSYTQFERNSGFYNADRTTTYIGVKIIKPDGTVKEVNADDIVLTKDESSEKKAKLAVPDLQPGDILDYFISSEQTLTNDITHKPYRLDLFDESPVLSLSFHAQLGRKYAIDYRSYNGAPELAVSKNDDKDIIVDVEQKDIPPFETSLWVSAAQQLPFISMDISLGGRGIVARQEDLKKPGEVSKNTDAKEIIEKKGETLSDSYYMNYALKMSREEYNDIESDTKKMAKKAGLNYKEMSENEKAAQLYYTLRFTRILNFDINKLADKISLPANNYDGLALQLFCTFKASGLKPAILVNTPRTGLRINEIMYDKELMTTAYLPATNQYFSIRSIFDAPFEIPDDLDGVTDTRSFTFDRTTATMGAKRMDKLTNIDNGPKIPMSTSDKNAHIENLKLTVTPGKNDIAVQRSTTLKGLYKQDAQKALTVYEDIYEAERKEFKQEKSLVEDLDDDRKSKKYSDEVRNAFADARAKQKDAFLAEAKDWFEQDITAMQNPVTDKLGMRHTSPDFVYSSQFQMGGLVKKAGSNIIVEIGKIQGSPFVVKPDQRKRTLDVFMPFARSIEYNIEIAIPDGYTADGIAALNTKTENETGFFSAEASATDKLVTIKVKKHYLHDFEPAANWDKLIAFTDAANNWVTAKLLLKKK